MPNFRSARWILTSLLAALLVGATLASASAWAGYGEVSRFNGKGTGGTAGKAFNLSEETHAFGVDQTDGSVYVGDERGGEESEKYRIQKYSNTGAFAGEALLEQSEASLPSGIEGLSGIEGVAIDHQEGVFYVLVDYHRDDTDAVDPNKEVAGALLAFNTTPAGGKLVPAAGTKEEGNLVGVLASGAALSANSETQGQALIEPAGIALDPSTHDVVILGRSDEGSVSGEHEALARISKSGAVDTRYVSPTPLEELGGGDSPVVSQSGRVFFEEYGVGLGAGGRIMAIPASFSGAPAPVFSFVQPETLTGLFQEELVKFGEGEAYAGDGLAIVPEGEHEGRFVAFAEEINKVEEDGTAPFSYYGALTFAYKESGGAVSVSELGWTGGQEGAKGNAKSCALGFEGETYPLMAAAPGKSLLVLSAASSEVITFGPTGEHCPTAKVFGSGFEFSIKGTKVSQVSTGTPVSIAAKVLRANVLSVEWNFGDGTKTTTQVPAGEQLQIAEVEHEFTKSGNLSVEAVIHTDNLQTPELKVVTSVTVKGSVKITKNPESKKLVEGQEAIFEAAAASNPEPTTVQWELSTDHGASFKPISGATATTYKVPGGVTVAESGYEYKAVFKNGEGESAVTAVATLTVQTKAEHEKEVAEIIQHEEEVKAEETRKQSEQVARETTEQQAREQAARTAREAQEAKEHQEQLEKAHQNVLSYQAAKATVAGRSLTVSASGLLTIKISCPAGAGVCTGTLTLRTLKAVKASAAGAHAAKSKATVLTLATGSFTVPAGASKTVKVHLSAKARKLLARSHVLSARATIVARNAAGQSTTMQSTLTLRLAKRH
jgi:hypothetical protein